MMNFTCRLRCSFLVAIALPLFLFGCGDGASDSPNLRFATEVARARFDALSKDRLTSPQALCDCYRECGLRVKAVSDRDVDADLALAARNWGDANIAFSNAINNLMHTPGADFAFLEGVVGLYAGEHPAAVGNRSSQRLANRSQAESSMEIAFTQQESAWADFTREMNSTLTPKEMSVLDGRLETWIGEESAQNETATVSDSESSDEHKQGFFANISAFLSNISKFGTLRVMVVVGLLIGGILRPILKKLESSK